MRTHRTAAVGLLLVAFLCHLPQAFAASPADQAAAEALFTEGKKLIVAGDVESGCKKMMESQRLDPTAGTGLNIGDCLEKQNKLGSAWGAFKTTEIMAREAGDTGRQAEAARRADALASRFAKLAIVVPPLVRVPGLEVRHDGALVGEGQWGSALPVDIGFHSIEASAPGYKTWSSGVRIETNGGSTSVWVQPLVKLVADQSPGARGPGWSTQRTIGVVLGAVGLVGLGVGSAFTVRMVSKNNDSLPHCLPTDITKCDATGVDLRNQAFDAAHVATGTFIAGAVVLAGGIAVFFTAPGGAPKKQEPAAARLAMRPIAGPGLAGAALRGVW